MRGKNIGEELRKREVILEAARECFSDRGISDTCMKDISKLSGISMGVIYKIFGSKDNIISQSLNMDGILFEIIDIKDDYPDDLIDYLKKEFRKIIEFQNKISTVLYFDMMVISMKRDSALKFVNDSNETLRHRISTIIMIGQELGKIDDRLDAAKGADAILLCIEIVKQLPLFLMRMSLSRKSIYNFIDGWMQLALTFEEED
ncbi:MAG: helix-turn-helix domain containing protein [Azospirillaceae bacterium]|nr:helix-turn-helix domain containing protein [Azospirillaceae bacterium]